METLRIQAGGQQEAARANDLERRLVEAELEIREEYRQTLQATRGLRKLCLWLEMMEHIGSAKRSIRQELAPDEGLYVAAPQGLPKGAGQRTRL